MITTLIDNIQSILYNIHRYLSLLFVNIDSFIKQFHNKSQLQHLVL